MIERPDFARAPFLLGLAVMLCLPVLLPAQTATTRVEENFRAEPNGILLGQVMPGTSMRSARVEGQWMEVTLEGWIWERSLQVRTGGDGELAVSAAEGENLREAPSGRVAARLGRGTVFEELERVPGWIRVRRSGWIWATSMERAESSVPSSTTGAAMATGASDGPTSSGGAPSSGGEAGSRWLRTGDSGAAILSGPDGDTLGISVADAELRLLSREGNWGRVQMDGWVWLPHMDADDETESGSGVTLDVTVAELARDPEGYRSRLVQLDLQFISVERAEQVRTDFYEGEPFLLMRSSGEGGFVYVALPAERLPEVNGLLPLERLIVIGRVRTGSAGITGSPILDLVEFRREPPPRR